jgi:hypothetical protein
MSRKKRSLTFLLMVLVLVLVAGAVYATTQAMSITGTATLNGVDVSGVKITAVTQTAGDATLTPVTISTPDNSIDLAVSFANPEQTATIQVTFTNQSGVSENLNAFAIAHTTSGDALIINDAGMASVKGTYQPNGDVGSGDVKTGTFIISWNPAELEDEDIEDGTSATFTVSITPGP